MNSRRVRYRKMEKGNPQLAFVSLKSVKARGTEGRKELKSDVTRFQNMLTCGGTNCSDSVPFICLGSQLVIVIKPVQRRQTAVWHPQTGGTKDSFSR